MDKIWHRGIIKYLQKKGLAPNDIHADMIATLGDDAPALSTMKKWAAEFKRGRESLEDDPRSGRPASATTQENIDCVHHMVMDDRRLTINQIADVAICRERVKNILHKELGMSKVSAQWVPLLLIPDQKHTRLVMSQANLAVLRQIQTVFLNVSLPKMNVGSITLKQRPNNNRCNGHTTLKEGQGGVVCRKGDGLRLLECKGRCVH